MRCAMWTDMQVKEIIDNILAFMSEGDELSQVFFVEQLKDMNKDLSNWNKLSVKDKMNLRSAFKEIMNMNEIGKLIKNHS